MNMKKRLLGILAGVSVVCITYAGAVFVNNDAPVSKMQDEAPISETPADYGVRIVSKKPISKAEIMKKYWSGVKEGDEVLTDTDEPILYHNSKLTETDESAVKIVSVEPISPEKIQENIDNCANDDILTDPIAREDEIPTWTFDLTTKTYENTFHFEKYVYTNRLFTTPHGIINVVVSASNALSSSLDTGYTIERYKKGSSEPVSSMFLEYDQEYHLEYPVFSSSEKYYFKLRKTSNGTYANGKIWVG